MQIKVEKLPKSEIKITIEVPEEKMKRFREKACEKISQEVKIKGFRPGHVPLHILEQEVGKGIIATQTLEIAIPLTYAEAVRREKLEVVSRPKVKIVSEEPFKYEAIVAVLPEVVVKDYDKIKVKKLDDEPDKKDVREAIEYMRKSLAEHKPITRPLRKGDRAEIDFEGFDEKGIPLENTKSKNHPLIIGDRTLVRDFEEELVGLKKGEKKEFTIKFPKPYHAKSLEGKKVKFKVEIRKTEEVIIPELDEKLVEKITGRKMSVKEFEADVEKNIRERKKEENRMKQENEFLEAILARTETEVPDALIEEEVDFMLDDMKKDMANRGVKFEDFMAQTKTTEEKLKEKYRAEAEKRVKIRLGLNRIFRIEKLEISDKNLEDEIERVTHYYPEKEKKKVRKMYEKNPDLKTRLKNRLLLKKLFDKFLKVG